MILPLKFFVKHVEMNFAGCVFQQFTGLCVRIETILINRKGSRARHTVKELKPIEAHGSDKAEPEESMAAEV